MSGKNFSTNNSSGKRRKADFYETPYSITRQLLDKEGLVSPILEPACGNGAITRELSNKGFTYLSYDINALNSKNFLDETERFATVITNPPYSLAYEFIKKAKEISYNKIILLLPLSYLHGKKRFDNVWRDMEFPLKQVYVFTRYPMLGEQLREDGKYHTGMMVYAWFVWEKYWKDKPYINWIDNDIYVLKKGE